MGKTRRRGGLILSGGPDSAVAAWSAVADKQHADVDWKAFHFQYGQLATPERQCAYFQAAKLGIPIQTIDLPEGLLTSTMTVRSEHRAAEGIEPTFVPGRNDIFISLAAARIYSRGRALVIVGGWNAADAAGYPDCTPGFLTAKAFALEKALDCEIDIVAPVIADMKHQIIERAVKMGIPLQHTWSCYTPILTDWGWSPCHKCVSCKFRDKGFKKAKEKDPLEFVELREV